MADNDSYEKDMEEIFGETRGERERKRLKQISDAAAESVRLANDFKQELKKEEKTGRKPLTSGQRTGILFMSWGLFIIAIGIIDYVDFKKTQRVKKQVEAFEKTLPAEYLEYKQAVEHYRDSLMNVKGR